MPLPIEDYAIIGDTTTAAVVGRDGSIDWLCLPRFDSPAVFSSLLGNEKHGFFRLAPKESPIPGTGQPLLATRRRYRDNTLVLETEFDVASGTVLITDCMVMGSEYPQILRLVECKSGSVAMRMDLVVRFSYGAVTPWVRRVDGLLTALAGPDGISLWTTVDTKGEGLSTVSEFTVRQGQRIPFVMTWYPSHKRPPKPCDAHFGVEETARWWADWSSLANIPQNQYRDAIMRSLITLKALTYSPTGGVIAAATTSLPESLGGERNWDYRYCWLRDATLTLSSLMIAGYYEEAVAWRDWLLRAVAGDPKDIQIMYGPAGERDLKEFTLDYLPGYYDSKPVRIGNGAAGQLQLDVYGEVMGALYESRRGKVDNHKEGWDLELALMDFLESGWKNPDEGIWEVRGPRRNFVHSKVMAWVAMDRAVKDVEEYRLEGPVDKWRQLRHDIHKEVCEKGFDVERGTFTQYYESDSLDASTLLIPIVGFLPPKDKRVIGTVEAIQKELNYEGFITRYNTGGSVGIDGLSGKEGVFLACSFWLADNLELIGRHDEANDLFDRLLALRNDLGLLSEEYDPAAKRLVGNFPQAFSHVALVNTAAVLHNEGFVPGVSHSDRIAGVKIPLAHQHRNRTVFGHNRHPVLQYSLRRYHV